jgi:hypothetical protein
MVNLVGGYEAVLPSRAVFGLVDNWFNRVARVFKMADSGHFLCFLRPERGQELHQGLGLELGQLD